MSEIKKLNRKIHEKFFGKCWCEYKSAPNGEVPFGRERCVKCKEIASVKLNYAENLSDAFLVVDEMKRLNYGWAGGEYYEVAEIAFVNNEQFFEASAETLEMAICRAVEKYLDEVKG